MSTGINVTGINNTNNVIDNLDGFENLDTDTVDFDPETSHNLDTSDTFMNNTFDPTTTTTSTTLFDPTLLAIPIISTTRNVPITTTLTRTRFPTSTSTSTSIPTITTISTPITTNIPTTTPRRQRNSNTSESESEFLDNDNDIDNDTENDSDIDNESSLMESTINVIPTKSNNSSNENFDSESNILLDDNNGTVHQSLLLAIIFSSLIGLCLFIGLVRCFYKKKLHVSSPMRSSLQKNHPYYYYDDNIQSPLENNRSLGVTNYTHNDIDSTQHDSNQDNNNIDSNQHDSIFNDTLSQVYSLPKKPDTVLTQNTQYTSYNDSNLDDNIESNHNSGLYNTINSTFGTYYTEPYPYPYTYTHGDSSEYTDYADYVNYTRDSNFNSIYSEFMLKKNDSTAKEFIVNNKYIKVNQDELTLYPGETVEVLEMYNDGWIKGRNKVNLEEGVFPSNIIDVK